MATQHTTKQNSDLSPGLSAPARRAFAGAGIQSFEHLAKFSVAQIKALHGIGPNALAQLRGALSASGLSFADQK